MALSDTRNFLVDLLSRFDPNLDLSEDSRASTELISPILARIGGDPFDSDIETFLRTRLQQIYPNLAITEADEATDYLIDPLRILLEPITREIQLIKLRTTLANLDVLSDDEVDALMGNFFESRRAGGYAIGVARLYFAAPQNVSVTLINVVQSRGGYRFLVPRPQGITASQMLLNIDGSEYYFDINLIAESRGEEYNIERSELVSIANLPAAIRISNLRRFTGGIERETNAQYVSRVQQGTSDKTLTTTPGIVAVLKDNFPQIRQLYEIGFGDPEMQRDVLRGGSLGAIPNDDDLGKFYGTGTPVDDLDADGTSPILQAAGNFITRVGAAGGTPSGWYVTLIYGAGGSMVIKDVAITQVLADNLIRVDYELPLSLGANQVTWMLREKKLTISDIPGGIAMPNTADGKLVLPSDAVHIGGKTDIFVAGEADLASAQIVGLTDEKPLARGFEAQTQALTPGFENIVLLPDISAELLARVTPGMSLVLAEGSDVGAYRILQVIQDPPSVLIDTAMTGEQGSLLWKIVDEIDVNLVQPKDVLLEGSDLILAAGSPIAIVGGGTNFTGAGIQPGDVLFVDSTDYGGDFTIIDVSATELTLGEPAARAVAGVHYVVSRRSEGLQCPVLRVKSLELLDSAGAPNGTIIPYRDPVLCVSSGFQTEGQGYLYDGPAFVGLLSTPLSGTVPVAFKSIMWETRSPAHSYGAPAALGTFTFGPSGDINAAAAQLNANYSLKAQGVRAVILTYAGLTYLGLTSQKVLTLVGGTALASLGWAVGANNCTFRGASSLSAMKVRRGDLIEFVSGNNNGASGRIVSEPSGTNNVTLGVGPLGPPGVDAAYDLLPVSPDAGGRVRVARPSVGSVRCYFLEPTSVNFDHRTTRFSVTIDGQTRVYQPDPENTRTLLPPPPQVPSPAGAVLNSGTRQLTHDETNFLTAGILPGDLIDVLYQPITTSTTVSPTVQLALGGKTLILQFDTSPFIQVSFPFAMTPADAATYINDQLGATVASVVDDYLLLQSSKRIQIASSSTALALLPFSTATNDHPAKGTYIVQGVAEHALTVSTKTLLPAPGDAATASFRVRRYVQRVSSTEMNLQLDASGLYYADVEAVSVSPGDYHNIGTGIELVATGYNSDGYRLTTTTPELSFSRAEELHAQVSRTLLLVGASDSPSDYVQVNLQNVQVSYERSALVDDIQSFCSSRYRRVICEDILVRHLLPHYISLNWRYAGGASEPEMTRALATALGEIEGGGDLEVVKLTNVLSGKQASSVFAVDPSSPSGRTAPQLLVVSHSETREVRASLVKDIVDTVRMCTYLPDNIVLRRTSSAGLR